MFATKGRELIGSDVLTAILLQGPKRREQRKDSPNRDEGLLPFLHALNADLERIHV